MTASKPLQNNKRTTSSCLNNLFKQELVVRLLFCKGLLAVTLDLSQYHQMSKASLLRDGVFWYCWLILLFCESQNNKITSSTERHCLLRMKLLTSGDIELNPGPEQHLNCQTILSVGFTLLLNLRLRQLGLRPVDVGGEGDFFFPSSF